MAYVLPAYKNWKKITEVSSDLTAELMQQAPRYALILKSFSEWLTIESALPSTTGVLAEQVKSYLPQHALRYNVDALEFQGVLKSIFLLDEPEAAKTDLSYYIAGDPEEAIAAIDKVASRMVDKNSDSILALRQSLLEALQKNSRDYEP